MTPIADMIERMAAEGIDLAIIVLAVRTVEESVTARDNALSEMLSALSLPLSAEAQKSRTRFAVNQANYREKLKQNKGAVVAGMAAAQTAPPPVAPITEAITPDNAVIGSVTIAPLSKKVLPIKEGEEKEEEEKKESKEVAPSKLPRARGTRLPDDWVPSEIDIDFALKRGHSRAVISIEGLKFRNYWTNRTDKQATKRSWHRAWQNWILNIRPTDQKNNVIAAADDLVDTMRQWEKTNESIEDLRSGEGPSNVWVLPAHRRG